jgi:glyoxylase-like metal-dependent hydrolase (beta-lactamase superfamily II)
MKIEVLGAHNTETDRARLPCLLVDDVTALDAGGLTSSLSLERQRKIKAVLLTHHHFDHTRDLVMLGANDSVPPSTVDVYGLPETLEVVYLYLLDGKMYKDYTIWPSADEPRLRLKPLAAFQPFLLGDLTVTPVPVCHSAPAVGYQVTSSGGKSIFYAGDTGPGLSECWQHVSPDVLFIEVTGLNRMGETMQKLRHLTPQLLAEELEQFMNVKRYIPRVIVTHVAVSLEEELKYELAVSAKRLEIDLDVAYEGLTIDL